MAIPPASIPPVPSKRRPNPQIAQFKRTFYFLRRNTLAIIGLGVVLFFVLMALSSFPTPRRTTPS